MTDLLRNELGWKGVIVTDDLEMGAADVFPFKELGVRAVEGGPYDWHTITDEQVDAVLSACLPAVLAAHNDGLFSRDVRLKESLFLRLRTVRLCALSIVKQLRLGRFHVAATELEFGKGDAFEPVVLTLSDGTKVRVMGRIDRVDKTAA